MSEAITRKWGLVDAMWNGVSDLFPTRKTKTAMWGVVALGVLTTYMELTAARLFSSLITDIDDQTAERSAFLLGGFLLAFAGIKGVQYFQSVYRLTIFEKSLRQLASTSRVAESWRWPMAIGLVGMLGQISRLMIVTITVAATEWMYGVLLLLCSLAAVVIVNRTGRTQYVIHHRFEADKKAGNPVPAAERIATRVRAGERAGLVAVVPVLVYVAALGFGAAKGTLAAHSALVLFIAGRMASNMYGSLSTETMRFIRSEVSVEAHGGSARGAKQQKRAGNGVELGDDLVRSALVSGGYIWEPPGQAFARLIDDGRFIGDVTTIGRIGRELDFGTDPSLRRHAPPPRPERFVATRSNQAWWHERFTVPTEDGDPTLRLDVVVDAFSRKIVRWRIGDDTGDAGIEALVVDACGGEGIAPEDVELYSRRSLFGRTASLHDFMRSLGVVRTLCWTGPVHTDAPEQPDRPAFPDAFASSADAEAWMDHFASWHNDVYYQPAVGYLHPTDVHAGLADVITTKRQMTLQEVVDSQLGSADARMPDAWMPPEEVWVEAVTITTISKELEDSEKDALQDDDDEI